MADQCYNHCRFCIKFHCVEVPDCPVERCENDCGVFLHACKRKEHYEYTCPEATVNCVNAVYGCTRRILRKKLTEHIAHCPASILECRFSYRRVKAMKNDESEDLNFPGDLIDEQLLAVDQTTNSGDDLDIDVINNHFSFAGRGLWSCITPPSSAFRQRTSKSLSGEQAFFCNELVRRDEFYAHWKTVHIDVQLSSAMCTKRCPMKMYGCTFGQNSLVPRPPGASICYDKDSDSHSFLPADPCIETDQEAALPPSAYVLNIEKKKELALYGYGDEEEESIDVLGQLPSEVLIQVISFLDSLSLWSLSQVNTYFRILCYEFVKKKGIVYGRWEKDAHSDLPWTHWVYSPPVVWSFSRVTSEVPGWMYADVPAIPSHMMSCDVYKSTPRNTHDQMKVCKAMIC